MTMRMMFLAALCCGQALAQGDASPEAFSQPMPGFSDTEREQFFRGRTLVRQSWVTAPSKDEQFDGLGPLYNRLACISCHPRNGRGRPPETADERMLSCWCGSRCPARTAHGGPKPHPAYGGQSNEEGIPGVPGEGRAESRWHEASMVKLAGGEKVSLRKPTLEVRGLASVRLPACSVPCGVGEQMVGMGYLDAASETTLEVMARETEARWREGTRATCLEPGRPSAWKRGVSVYKSNMPTLRAQSRRLQWRFAITSPPVPRRELYVGPEGLSEGSEWRFPRADGRAINDVEFISRIWKCRLGAMRNLQKSSRGVTGGNPPREHGFAQAGCTAAIDRN